ncbi:MAG: methyltransferase domain-containing protein [Actinomycetota bacterium]
MSRKRRIAAAFSAAAGTYETAAEAQARAADELARLVAAEPLPPHPRVLELGCGTGLLTRRLLAAVSGGSLLASDVSPAMVEAARQGLDDPRLRFAVVDAEAPGLAERSFDLVVSGFAAQWFTDLAGTLAGLARLVAPGGRLMLSMPGSGSFAEWRRAAGADCGIPGYPDAAAVAAMLPGLRVVARPFTVTYADARAFLATLKAIGAGTPAAGHRPLPPGRLRRIMAGLGAPCAITYDVLYLSWSP